MIEDDGGFARRETADDYLESVGVWCDVCGGEIIDCGGCGQLVEIETEYDYRGDDR